MKTKSALPSAVLGLVLLTGCKPMKLPEVNILPLPNKYECGKGSFTLSNATVFICKSEAAGKEGRFLVEALKQKSNISIAEKEAAQNIIVLSIDSVTEMGDEGYRLIIWESRIEISAARPAGLFYGIQSLVQLCNGKESVALKCISIEDAPAFKWRGMMLDECRHFFGKEFVLTLLDQAAALKMNRFHWHLTDDQGWRIEIKKYPRLTEVGGWRKDDSKKEWNYAVEPAEEGKPRYGGFYTQEAIKEIVAYAADRHIIITPEIEMPGHSTAAITSYPELSCKGQPWKPGDAASEFSDPLCAGNDKVFEMYGDIVTEVAALFPSPYIHIGGDECKKDPWKTCPKCQKRMKDEKLSSVEELQSYFVKRMEKIIQSKGKRIIGWDEILEGGLAPEATVMSWRGVAGGIAAANDAHDVIMTPTDFCYFDYYQGNPATEPRAIGGFLLLSKVYAFNPLPEGLDPGKRHFILGGQANLWAEYIATPDYAEYMLFPRLFAMAEVLWTKKEKQSYPDFLSRLVTNLATLSDKKINFRMLSPEGMPEKLFLTTDTTIAIGNPLEEQGAEVHYTIDGSEPDRKSLVYQYPLSVKATTCIKARLYLGDRGGTVSQSWVFIYNPETNGLGCDLFKGSWNRLPGFDSLKAVANYRVSHPTSHAPDSSVENYAIRFKGFYQVDETKEYAFYTASDDGSRLLIDNKTVVENDSTHGTVLKTGKMQVEKGVHEIEIQYFQGTGGKGLDVGTLNGIGDRQPLDPAKLFFKK